ncbi:MAG: galactokinase [Desulfofustis sp.]|nr:galactokinase [Desulfofustis sp.]
MNSTVADLKSALAAGQADQGLTRLYGKAALAEQRARYRQLLADAEPRLEGSSCFVASAPGRTELGGNHTDHNNGRVLASAVDLDCIAAVAPSGNDRVSLSSREYPEPLSIRLDNLSPDPAERNSPEALIRGVGAARQQRGRAIRGFTAVIDSTCKPGTGLSSSAAFGVLVGGIFGVLEDEALEPLQLARYGQFAENEFFGKPCGLMDQLSSAAGYTLGIDFADPDNPAITRIDTDFEDWEYRLLIIDTGGSHSDLTEEYAAVTEEIGRVTRLLQRDKARGLSVADLLGQIAALRAEAGDRALLRVLHFITDDLRADRQSEALLQRDYARFLELVRQSGDSSCTQLQNCSSSKNTKEQGILLAISLTRQLFPRAVCRVHGGGFSGTAQAYVPKDQFDDYQSLMGQVFGEGSVIPVKTGRPGFCHFTANGWLFPATGEGS